MYRQPSPDGHNRSSRARRRKPVEGPSPGTTSPPLHLVISSAAKRSREISLAALNGVSCRPSNPPGKRTSTSAVSSQLCGIPSPSVVPTCPSRHSSERLGCAAACGNPRPPLHLVIPSEASPLSILSFRAQRSGVEKSPWLHSTGSPVDRQTHPKSAPVPVPSPLNSAAYHRPWSFPHAPPVIPANVSDAPRRAGIHAHPVILSFRAQLSPVIPSEASAILSFRAKPLRRHPVISSAAKRSREISLAALNGVSCRPSNPPGKRTSTSAVSSQLCGIPSPSVVPTCPSRHSSERLGCAATCGNPRPPPLHPVTPSEASPLSILSFGASSPPPSSCHFERSEAESRNLHGCTQRGVL